MPKPSRRQTAAEAREEALDTSMWMRQRLGRLEAERRGAERIPSPNLEVNRDPAAGDLARIRAVFEAQQEHLLDEEVRSAGAKELSQVFKHHARGPCVTPAYTTAEYRAYILAHSLFPNLFNKKQIYTHHGST
tara:strand:+ start:162 stop:560 length:399 start_codon:yes stop_codon:yes gene_type:complete